MKSGKGVSLGAEELAALRRRKILSKQRERLLAAGTHQEEVDKVIEDIQSSSSGHLSDGEHELSSPSPSPSHFSAPQRFLKSMAKKISIEKNALIVGFLAGILDAVFPYLIPMVILAFLTIIGVHDKSPNSSIALKFIRFLKKYALILFPYIFVSLFIRSAQEWSFTVAR